MTDHEFAIDFVARMIRFSRGGEWSAPIQEEWTDVAKHPRYADAVRMLEERLESVREESYEEGKDVGLNGGPFY